MPQVVTISSQPSSNDIISVYRPILFTVNVADTVPPQVVYCDVYVNDIFYRTLTKTLYKKLNTGSSDWEFDIQDPCQEVLGKHLPLYGGSNVIVARPCSAVISCKFRGSTIDSNGFVVPGGTAPVQGTATTLPSPGTGLQSNAFFILNVALQHQHNQTLSSHLSAYKNGTFSAATYPMSHRINGYIIGANQNDYYPIFYKGNGLISKLRIKFKNRGQVTTFTQTATVTVKNIENTTITLPGVYYFKIVLNGDGTQTVTFYFPVDPTADLVTLSYNDGSDHNYPGPATSPRSITIPVGTYTYSIATHFVDDTTLLVSSLDVLTEDSNADQTKGVYFIPNGPKNLASLFPTITWRNLKEYYVEVLDDADAVIATSTVNTLQDWNVDDYARVYFLNDCGTYDALNFLKPKAVLEDSASEYQTSVNSPLSKSDFSANRFNVRAGRTYEVKRKSIEQEMPWLEECKRSVQSFMDWIGTEGQSDDYMSIVLLNGKMDSLKDYNDYQYDFVMQFRLSNDFFSIRN
jgi:hypothetical protein